MLLHQRPVPGCWLQAVDSQADYMLSCEYADNDWHTADHLCD